MKIITKENSKRLLSLVLSFVMAFSLCMPAFATEQPTEQPTKLYGTVETFTAGLSVEGTQELTVTNKDAVTLSFSKRDDSVGRLMDGWWAGIKIVAPADLTEEELETVNYRKWNGSDWGETISFWEKKDSEPGAANHYMQSWMCVTPEIIANDADKKLTLKYQFDWYGNGFEGAIQEITFVLDINNIILDHENYYADVEGITQGLTITGADTNEVVIINEEEITLDFAPMDESIERPIDGWWAGVKILAPEELSEDELKQVKYCRSSKGVLGEKKSFWDEKVTSDGADRHYITKWVAVTPEYIKNDTDGFLTYKFVFDWDNNGFGISAQEITVKIDVTKVKLIHSEGCTKVVEKEAVAPDCMNSGNNEKSYCSVCGLVIGDGAEIGALGHDFTEKIIDEEHFSKAKTCASYAEYFYDCSRCDEKSELTFENEAEGLEPHVEKQLIDERYLASAAGCETPARYYMACENCDTVLKDKTFDYGEPMHHLFMLEKVTVKAGLGKDGATNFLCVDCGEIDNESIRIAGIKTVTLSTTSYDYNGKAFTPSVTVKDSDGVALIKDTDYTVSYKNNKAPGKASATVTFIGKYEGSKTLDFTIRQLPATGKASYTSTTSEVKLSWNKVNNATGYKVYDSKGKEVGSTTGTSVTLKKLSSATKYTFTVKAYAAVDGKTYVSNSGKSINAVTKPAVTASLTASTSTTSATLKWSKVSGADSYTVYKYNADKKTYEAVKTVTGTSYTVSGLKSATSYDYAVSANKLTDDKSTVTGDRKTVKFTTNPDKISTLTASAGASSVTLKWSKVSRADSYNVYKYDSKTKTYKLYKTVTGTSLTVKDLKGTTSYDFEVRAVKSKVTGAAKSVKVTTTPDKVSSFTATAGATSVTLKWSKLTGADSYNIYKYDSKTKTYKLYKNVKGTSLTVKSLKSNTSYSFEIRAVKGKVTGAAKSVKVTTTPEKVSKLSATVTTTSVTLKWSKVSGADSYKVYKYNSKTKKYDLYKTVKGTSLTIKDLKAATTYAYSVRAVKGKITGAEKIISVTTKPNKISKLSAASTSNSVTLSWSKVKGASNYNVYKYNSKTKKYDFYKTVSGTSITIKSLKADTSYKYSVRSVKVTADGEKTLGDAKNITVKTKVAAPKDITVSSKSGKVTVKWSKVSGAKGYQIAYKDAKGNVKAIGDVKSDVTSLAKSGFKKGAKYVFGVRSYKLVDGKKVYSSFKTKTITVK